jgi:hypothetical protein
MTDATSPPPVSLIDCFRDLEDPRLDRTKRHPLINIVFMALCALCAVLSDAEGWSDIEDFARVKQDWFAQHLDLPEGPHRVPSDDTFRRVFARPDLFARLDPEAFEASFRRWVAAVAARLEGGPGDVTSPHSAPALSQRVGYRAAAYGDGTSPLAQQTVESRTNEITVLPDLLAALDLAAC